MVEGNHSTKDEGSSGADLVCWACIKTWDLLNYMRKYRIEGGELCQPWSVGPFSVTKVIKDISLLEKGLQSLSSS